MDAPKILICDGSAFIRIMLNSILSRLGFQVVGTARDSQEALDKCVESKADVILLDIRLDGDTLIKTMIDENPSANIILLVAEGADDSDLVVAAVRAGVKGYIKKPLSAEELEKRLNSIMRKG